MPVFGSSARRTTVSRELSVWKSRSGGYGGLLVQTIDWAPRDKMLHSYELLARYVMPQFQGSVASTTASNRWAHERRDTLLADAPVPLNGRARITPRV